MSVISWDAEPNQGFQSTTRFLGSPIPHCWWFHQKTGKFTPSPLEGRLVVYIPSLKPEVFDIASVVFRAAGVSQPNSLRHLRWAPFSLIRPCRSLEGIVLKNLRNTLRKAFNEPNDQPKEMRKIINKSSWLYLGPKIKSSGENRFQWIHCLKTLVKSGKKLQLITIDSSPFHPFTWTTITVTITPREIWRWLKMHSLDCAR